MRHPMVGSSERSDTDKKRSLRKKKKLQRSKAMKQRSSSIKKPTEKESFLQKRGPKGSTNFFSQLQEEVHSRLQQHRTVSKKTKKRVNHKL